MAQLFVLLSNESVQCFIAGAVADVAAAASAAFERDGEDESTAEGFNFDSCLVE